MTMYNEKLETTKKLLLFALLVFILALISLSSSYSKCVTEGVFLWFYCVFPTLFPYVFVVGIIDKLNLTNGTEKLFSPLSKRLFRTNGNVITALIISLLSGYPVGAKTVGDLKTNNLISQTEGERASAICSTSSPSFLIATVGALFFKSKMVGIILFVSQFLTSILIGFIFSLYKRTESATTPQRQNVKVSKNLLYDNIYSSIISVLLVGGMITIFYLIAQVLMTLKLDYPLTLAFNQIFNNETLSKGLTMGIIECTSGLKLLAQNGTNVLTISLSSLICGLGGISVIFQSLAFLKNAKIKTTVFLISKPISAVLNFIITFVLCLFCL